MLWIFKFQKDSNCRRQYAERSTFKGEKSFFNHKTMKKLFLDWIRNEISFIYRNENQIMQQVSSNNLDDSGFSLTQLLSVTFHALFSEFIFTIFADISISPSLLAAHKKKIYDMEKSSKIPSD